MQTVHERVAYFSQADSELIFSELSVSEKGLSEAQVALHGEMYGENRIVNQGRDTFFYRLRRAFVNPFSVVLFLIELISFVTDVLLNTDSGSNGTTVFIMLSMLFISGIVRLIQELSSKQITDELKQLVNTTVTVKREGFWTELSSEALVVGDIVRLEAGDRVPADIRLLKVREFFVSQPVITGESGILEKQAENLAYVPSMAGDYRNVVFLGSTVTGGMAEGIVLAVGKDTLYGGISPNTDTRKKGYERGENSIAWVLIKFMVMLVPIVFLASGLTKHNWLEAFLFALSVAVGLMPELLPMVITACLAKGSYSMGQKQTVVKNINAMQGFGSMDVLCVDKTGTLTGDTVLLEYYMDVLGNESQKVLDYAYLNSYYHTGVANHLDEAILKARTMAGHEAHFLTLSETYKKIDELPFDYNRRCASVLVECENEKILLVKGSVSEVVSRCRYIEYKNQRLDIMGDSAESVQAIVDEMLEDGMKVLAVAVKKTDKGELQSTDERDLTLLGYLAFFDAPKKSAAEAIGKLQKLNIAVKVLTGDHADVAASVCRRVGVTGDIVWTGRELDALSNDELSLCLEHHGIFAELSPKQKARIVEVLRENGHCVGFLGDGMNDLPAVMQADVGISVDTAMDAVKESADVILLKKDLNVLDACVWEGRRAFTNMSKYIRITASSNFGNICAIVVASVLLPFFPMTSVQLLLLNLLYDILCLALPWDHVDEEMLQKPQEWSGGTLGRFMLFFGPLSSVFDILMFAFLYFYLCPLICGCDYGSLGITGRQNFIAIFQTGWFLESLWTQILILHSLRTKKLPFIQSKPSGVVIRVTILGIVLFTLLTITPVGALLGLTVLPPVYFVFLILTVVFYLAIVTLMKKVYVDKYGTLL